jgi:alkylated DNA repair dioxygenase AlkB
MSTLVPEAGSGIRGRVGLAVFCARSFGWRTGSLHVADLPLSGIDGPAPQPEGLRYAADVVSVETEQRLISGIRDLPLQPFQFGQFEGKRRVASFGFRYDYALRQLQRSEPIPAWLDDIVAKVETFGGPETSIRQVLCTEYDVGVGIGWHRDKPHFERIFGLSLGSACKFRFRKSAGKSWYRFTLDAEPRSLYMMSGASRRIWEHGIPAVESPRYSITFRTMSNAADPGTSA